MVQIVRFALWDCVPQPLNQTLGHSVRHLICWLCIYFAIARSFKFYASTASPSRLKKPNIRHSIVASNSRCCHSLQKFVLTLIFQTRYLRPHKSTIYRQRPNHVQRGVTKCRMLGFRLAPVSSITFQSAQASGKKAVMQNAQKAVQGQKPNNWFKSFAALSGTC